MSLTALAVLVLAASGGPPADAEIRSVQVSLWAVQAAQEGRRVKYFDPGLEAIKRDVADLPFDSFYALSVVQRRAVFGEEAACLINDRYTLFAKPVSYENGERIRMEIRVLLTPAEPDRRPVNALKTSALMAPGKKIKVRGFPLEPGQKGEMVLLLAAQ